MTNPTANVPGVLDPGVRRVLDFRQLKTELVYGRSGSGKTSWILKLARYLYLKTGKRTIWYLGDGGGETITITGWADPGGFIDLYPYIVRDNPIETSQLICEGYRPEDPSSTKTRMIPRSAAEMDDIGLWVFEGLNVMSDYIMGDKWGGLANRMARGEMLNKDDSFRIKDGDLQFGGNARTHYGFTQRKMLDLIGRTVQLPGIKYWTAHELKVDDTDNRETMFGPDVVGQKLTPRIGASFGNTIHLHVAHLEESRPDPKTGKPTKQIRSEYRAYTRTHYDPDGTTTARYFANTRMDARVVERWPEIMPEFLVPANPVEFYRLLDTAKAREAELDAETLALPDIGLVAKDPPGRTRGITLE